MIRRVLAVVGLAIAFSVPAAVYKTIEGSFSITNLATDPFDYATTDVRVQIIQPDLSSIFLPAFFDGGTTWRVRHAPNAPGLYQIAGITLNGQPLLPANLQPSSWTVSGRPTSPGYIRLDPANPSRFITSNGRGYFPVGHNVGWDTSVNTNVVSLLARLGGARENWSRIWMDDWDGKNLDWPKPGPFGQLSLSVAQKWDNIVSAAERSGVYFQMTLQHHGQYSSNVDPEWSYNPYNSANGGFLVNATQFFTNATARALTKRKLRYAVARWGYSPAIMAWELFNEVQFTDAAQAGLWNRIGEWHDEMAQFLRAQDSYHHLVTTSSDLNQPIWSQCDYYTHHDYPADLISALSDPPGPPSGQPVKPIFGAECGLDSAPHLGVNAPLWAGLMGAQSGNAQPWWWDRIDAAQDYAPFRAVRDFTLYAGVAEQDNLARSSLRVTTSQAGSLVFAPGGGWATAVQDTFVVGDSAPAGIGTLPSYLQGNYHRSMTPNGYTFLVNYPPGGGTFSVQILIIAQSGAGLTVYLDGAVANSVSFPPGPADQNTNYVVSINVPAGNHTVKLWNPGLDWVDLGNITLNPYTSMLGAYQIANPQFAAAWVWHRTNIYNAGANSTLTGSFPLQGLQPGVYSGTWWDTFSGIVTSNFSFSVADTNPVIIPTPPILRSIAFFAGAAPRANIAAPLLSLSLSSNAPPQSLSLTITNSGGLPLAYWLSVTGANPVAYSALNSTMSAGPAFAWKDISAIGRDLTGSFTALTARNAKDEGIAGPVELGFSFPFFNGEQTPGMYDQLYVSPNGFVTFTPFTGNTSTNVALPNASAPANCIAFFWQDLDLSASGKVYCLSDPLNRSFTLQFQNVPIRGTAATVTCQLILKSCGEIDLQYKSVGISNACTVGLQDGPGSSGLTLAYNQAYLQSSFAASASATPWLELGASAGLVPRSNLETVTVTFNPAGLSRGRHEATLLVETADPASPVTPLPVTLDILAPLEQWRLEHFGQAGNDGEAADLADPDQDGVINIFEYAFNTNPTNAGAWPVSYNLIDGHLTILFNRAHPAPPDIRYSFEVAPTLDSGSWRSGPAFTSQTVTDNEDGTETVRVTDLLPVNTAPAHYLRVGISVE